MNRRSVADVLALVVFLVVVVSGLIYLALAPPTPKAGTSVVSTSSPSSTATASPGMAATGEEKLSVWDRAFSSEILDILRIVLVVAAAFALAGVAQRVTLGQYAFKAGPVEFSALDASADGVKDVVAAVEKVRTETSDSVARLKEFVDLTVATSGAESRQLRDELRRVTQRLDRGGNEP